MNYDLSIIIPGIRPERWHEVLKSIQKSCSYEYEVIFIGPVALEDAPLCCVADNIKVIQDFANPNICQHKAMWQAKGEILHVFSDDCVFEPNSITTCIDHMRRTNSDAVVANYHEGGNIAVPDFSLNYCYAKTCTPDSFVIFNTAFMKREPFFELGGFDCDFETLCVAQADLAARWQFSGYTVDVCDVRLSSCGHMPGTSGDHAPMHYAQLMWDIPLYVSKYRDVPDLKVDSEKWKYKSSVWERRFKCT